MINVTARLHLDLGEMIVGPYFVRLTTANLQLSLTSGFPEEISNILISASALNFYNSISQFPLSLKIFTLGCQWNSYFVTNTNVI